MSPDSKPKSSNRKSKLKDSTIVITVRIDEELNEIIEKNRLKLGISKADFIRNYLEMAKYLVINPDKTIKSLHNRDFIIIKKSLLKKLIEVMDEKEQMELGIKVARFITDIATLQGELDNIDYKLDLCEHLGFFPKLIDDEKYILFSRKFGPKKFIEAFVYKLIKYEPKYVYDTRFTEENIKSQSKIKSAHTKELQQVERLSSHYSFEFAKISEDEDDKSE